MTHRLGRDDERVTNETEAADWYYTIYADREGRPSGECGPEGPLAFEQARAAALETIEPHPVTGWRTIVLRPVANEAVRGEVSMTSRDAARNRT
jgi:hypothetical protein